MHANLCISASSQSAAFIAPFKLDIFEGMFELNLHYPPDNAIIGALGMWLSWLARFAHIEEVGGSSPSIPTKLRVFLTRFYFYLKRLKTNDYKDFLKNSILT